MLFTSCPARRLAEEAPVDLSKGGYNSPSITPQALTSLAVLLLSVKLGKGYPLRTGRDSKQRPKETVLAVLA
jgi:hypothetical protein